MKPFKDSVSLLQSCERTEQQGQDGGRAPKLKQTNSFEEGGRKKGWAQKCEDKAVGVWEGIQNPSLFPGLRATTKLAITASASTNSRETEATR